jgi:hypothetical protein
MTTQTELAFGRLTDMLESRLSLLRELARELVVCRRAYVAMDLEAIYGHIERQSAACRDLREAEESRSRAWQAVSATLEESSTDRDLETSIETLRPDMAAHLRRVLSESALAEDEIRHLNQANTVLIDGSRRTLNVLANVLVAFSPTYARPAGATQLEGVALR